MFIISEACTLVCPAATILYLVTAEYKFKVKVCYSMGTCPGHQTLRTHMALIPVKIKWKLS